MARSDMTMPTSARLFSVAARLGALVVSTWGALFGLFSPTSLIARAHDQFNTPMDVLNMSILTVAALGFADIMWHDMQGKLIWPSFSPRKRHRVCVAVYSFFGATWLGKAFVSASAVGAVPGASLLGLFALSLALVCGVIAVAIALEQR